MQELRARDLIDSAVSGQSAAADQAAVRLVIGVERGLRVIVDEEALSQALSNLISRAIRLTPPQSAVLVCAAMTIDHALCISVFDKSAGEADDSTCLANAQAIAEQHGGVLQFEYSAGIGGCVLLTIPRCRRHAVGASSQADTTGHPRTPDGSGHPQETVLVVDDDDGARAVVGAYLRTIGVRCVEARDGLEALDRVHAACPDLIVLDIGMPRMNGFAFVEVLRAMSARVPLIIYSGRDLTASERLRLRLGPTRYLAKSRVTEDVLLHTVQQLLARSSAMPLDRAAVP